MPSARAAALLALTALLAPALAGCVLGGATGELQVTLQQRSVPYGDAVVAFATNAGDGALEGPVTMSVVNATTDARVRVVQLQNGTPRAIAPGERVGLVWDGRADGGDMAPWGPYRLVVRAGGDEATVAVEVERPLVRFLRVDAPEKNVTMGEAVPLVLRNSGEVGFSGRVAVEILNNTRWELVAAWNLTGVELPPGGERPFQWDGRTRDGAPAPAGRYLARVVFSDGARADVPSTDWFSLRNPR